MNIQLFLQSEVKPFEIDERTFYAFDDEGHMLDDDLGVDEMKVSSSQKFILS